MQHHNSQFTGESPASVYAGRIVCAKNGLDCAGTIRLRDGRIESIDLVTDDDDGREVADITFPNGILLPGLIDLHAHPAKSDSVFGVDPDQRMLARGTTTVLSQGDAGANHVDEFIANTVRTSQTRVLLALNLSRIGESTTRGCFENLADADIDACVAAASRFPAVIRMIAVNVSHNACGHTDPREILGRACIASDETGLPLLYGMRRPEDWPLEDQLGQLRAGDVVTYCFRQHPHCIVNDGKPLPHVFEARHRGVRFDVGHGTASFSFRVAESAIAHGFLPDTISTDLQNRHAGCSPIHDLPLVMSKLAASQMGESDVIRSVTTTPASILGLEECGCLDVGAVADFVVLEQQASVELTDCHNITRDGCRLVPRCVVRAGVSVAMFP